MISTRAKPRTAVVPCQYSQLATRIEETFESRMLDQARLNPASMAGPSVLPARISSFIRSKMRMLASTAMPIDEDEGRDAGERQRDTDDPEDGVGHQRVEDQRDRGQHARQAVVGDHEEEDQQQADRRRR